MKSSLAIISIMITYVLTKFLLKLFEIEYNPFKDEFDFLLSLLDFFIWVIVYWLVYFFMKKFFDSKKNQ